MINLFIIIEKNTICLVGQMIEAQAPNVKHLLRKAFSQYLKENFQLMKPLG
jgi:spore coat protein CotF